MPQLTDLQRKILGSIYFVEPFENILEEAEGPENFVADDLKTLIDKGMVQVMEPNEEAGGFKRSFMYDSDDMRAFHYLITRDGLQAYNQH